MEDFQSFQKSGEGTAQQTTKKKPKTITESPIRLVLWENENESGKYENYTLERTYMDKKTKEFKKTGSYRIPDTAKLKLCLVRLELRMFDPVKE